MNQVEVKILQQSYLLACKEGQEIRLTEAVRLVDDAMTRIHDAGKVRARERIAVLAALNLAYELGDLRLTHAQLLEQLPVPSTKTETVGAQAEATNTQEVAAAFHAQTQALDALVARLEAVLHPAEMPAHVLAEQSTPEWLDLDALVARLEAALHPAEVPAHAVAEQGTLECLEVKSEPNSAAQPLQAEQEQNTKLPSNAPQGGLL